LATARKGIGTHRPASAQEDAVILLCGLAGSLVADLPPGRVIIPETVGLPDGRRFPSHPGWVEALRAASDRLGLTVDTGPLLTAPVLVTGAERAVWAAQEYRAADMEAGLLLAQGRQVASVRVILDSPDTSISDRWERPIEAVLRPDLWREMLWMVRHAPRYARLAARIVRQALT
jgi:4-hydroxy-3-methylbut-2-enyl diphosphate reductase